MKIDWKARVKNPIFWINTIIAFLAPILVYYKVSSEDFTSWSSIFTIGLNALKNPYVLGLALVSLWNNIINPTTKGIRD
ncbi:phage holin [[Clostridium] colinum]|uniref:phage holin n=1 Tax=[Clostridium] colinum TaxID=36835 RepID=UPI0020250C49|nr:phage holin [[Clostridium] colinum]